MTPHPNPLRTRTTRGAEWEGWFLQLDPDQPAATFIQPQRTLLTWGTDFSGASRVIASAPTNPAGIPIDPIPDAADDPGSILYEEVWAAGEVTVPFRTIPPEHIDPMGAYFHHFLTAQGIVTDRQPTASEYAFALVTLKQTWTLSDAAERVALAVVVRAPGVSIAGSTTDRAGRAGLVLDLAPTDLQPGYRTQLVIDPDAGRLLGVETSTTDGIPKFAVTPGSVTDYTLWR